MRRRIGVYNLISQSGGAGKSCAVVAERLSRDHDVSLIIGDQSSASQLETFYGVELSRVRVISLNLPVQNLLRRWSTSGNLAPAFRARFDLLRVKLRATLEQANSRQIRALGLDLLINKHSRSILRCPAPRGIYLCMFPRAMKGKGQGNPTHGILHRAYRALGDHLVGMTDDVLDSYQIIAANSSFTAEWVERLWRRKATVVYSSCEDMGPPTPKEKIIFHAGRFTARWRHDYKHQRTLLDVFRGMASMHERGWRLHFAGSLDPGGAGANTMAELHRAAAGLPVEFHPNASFDVLRNLYRRASIYWHATGYGSSAEQQPEKQEHFGITVVEAMSAGAVPVALNSGGPRETVQHECSGFLWNNLAELRRYTELLASDPTLMRQLGENAIASSLRFQRAAFEEQIAALTESLLRRNV